MTKLWKDKKMEFIDTSVNEESKSIILNYRLLELDGKIFSNDALTIIGIKGFKRIIHKFEGILNKIVVIDLTNSMTIRFFDSSHNLLVEVICSDYELNHIKNTQLVRV